MLGSRFMKLQAAFLAATFVLSGCGGEGKKTGEFDPSIYDGWETYTYGRVKIVHPPGHPLENTFHGMADGYADAIKKGCQFLQIPMPEDTLVVYYYTGYGQGRAMTGAEHSFATDSAIHFWLPSFYGPTLMQYLMKRWLPKEPQYKFLKHGIITLYDFSGQNYHLNAYMAARDGSLMPLTELAEDTMVDSNRERRQSAWGASFVDFLVFSYGPEALRLLYRAEAPFELACEGILGVKADSLQEQWLSFVDNTVSMLPPGQRIIQGDTVQITDR